MSTCEFLNWVYLEIFKCSSYLRIPQTLVSHDNQKFHQNFLDSDEVNPVFPKLFEPRHTKLKPEISRHTYQSALIFLPSSIALLVLDQLNLQLNLN